MGLVDALTGEALNNRFGLFQCDHCKVYYHPTSYDVIQSENSGRCVACLAVTIRPVSVPTANRFPQSGFNYQPEVITLTNYREHLGHVITFEGYVQSIRMSRSGNTYALMFEDTNWAAGLKLVIFRRKESAVGGAPFIGRLLHKTVRVRGLLQKHAIFGYQIIVSERTMIQDVR